MKLRSNLPRLSIFRSNKYIWAQIIDDQKGVTLAAASSKKNGDPHQVGLILAKAALVKKIKAVVFDRGSYKYHGRVRSLAEGAREGGLKL